MTRIDRIINHPVFVQCLQDIEAAEKDRIFCCHGMEHSLDVARISYIMALEDGMIDPVKERKTSTGFTIQKDIIYAMALLHDIGRSVEYKDKTPHHMASEKIAQTILRDCDFYEDEINAVCRAISCHKKEVTDKNIEPLSYYLFKADKLSRNCFSCEAYEECYWAESLKNKGVTL